MKQRRDRKHNFIEVENKITYGESIVNQSNLPFTLFYNRCCLSVFLFVSAAKLIFYTYEILKISKMSCNTLILQ